MEQKFQVGDGVALRGHYWGMTVTVAMKPYSGQEPQQWSYLVNWFDGAGHLQTATFPEAALDKAD